MIKDESDQSNEKNFFLQYAVLFDSLDEKFNSLRHIPYNANARRVINVYWTVFLIMLNALYSKSISNDFVWDHKHIYDLLNQPYNEPFSSQNYYKSLFESGWDYKIATTNYTDIAEKETKNKNVIYLHGKLTWFEDLKKLTVYDCKSDNEKKYLCNPPDDNFQNIIPYILIPSGVKPLICKKQIECFNKFCTELEECNRLVVVGYRFNSEDNHINSIIADWLRKSDYNKIIFFNYNNSIDLKTIDCFKNNGDKQIESISVDEKNAIQKFDSLLSKLKSGK